MSLFNTFDRDNYLGEVNTPRETQGQGTFTTAKQQSLLIANIFGASAGVQGLPAGVGLGGAVTQLTSKATAVTLNTGVGQITMNNASLGAATLVNFVLNNSVVLSTDQVLCYVIGGAAANGGANYTVSATVTGAGAVNIGVRNNTAGALTDALVIQFEITRLPIT